MKKTAKKARVKSLAIRTINRLNRAKRGNSKTPKLLAAALNGLHLGFFGKQNGLGRFEKKEITPEVTFNSNRISKTGKRLPDGVEIRFPGGIPTASVRDRLKEMGFQFSSKQEMWYAYENEKTREFVNEFGKKKVETYDVDDIHAEGERRFFWAPMNKANAGKVPATAQIKVIAEGKTRYFDNKDGAIRAFGANLWNEILSNGQAWFKKFWTVKPEKESERETEQPNNHDDWEEKERELDMELERQYEEEAEKETRNAEKSNSKPGNKKTAKTTPKSRKQSNSQSTKSSPNSLSLNEEEEAEALLLLLAIENELETEPKHGGGNQTVKQYNLFGYKSKK